MDRMFIKDHRKNSIYFDRNHRNIDFRIHEEVLFKDISSLRSQSVKFGNPWKKAVVVDKIHFNSYVISVEGKKVKVNVRKLRKLGHSV